MFTVDCTNILVRVWTSSRLRFIEPIKDLMREHGVDLKILENTFLPVQLPQGIDN